MYIVILNLIPVLDLIGNVAGYIAQYKKLKETRNSEGISITKQVINMILLIFWILYGIEYCTLSYIITCAISLMFCIFEIILTLWYREVNILNRLQFLSRKNSM